MCKIKAMGKVESVSDLMELLSYRKTIDAAQKSHKQKDGVTLDFRVSGDSTNEIIEFIKELIRKRIHLRIIIKKKEFKNPGGDYTRFVKWAKSESRICKIRTTMWTVSFTIGED